MLRRDVVLALASVLAPALVAAGDLVPSLTVPRALELRLAWMDPLSAASGTEGIARAEVARVLARMGVSVRWRRASAAEQARPDELRVIFLDRAAERRKGTPVLGATPAHFLGEPFIWVHVPGVRSALGISPRSLAANLDLHSMRALSIGLGRVIAHEIVHALAPELPHGRGLMSAQLDSEQLTSAAIAFDPEVALAVRTALLVGPPAPRLDDRVLAAQGAQDLRR